MKSPAPWHVEKASGGYEIWPKDEGQTHSSIARVYREDDARLIAAAPDLLEQLQALCEQLKASGIGMIVPPNVLKAIAKATKP